MTLTFALFPDTTNVELRNSLVYLPPFKESIGEVVVGFRIVRVDFHRFLKLGNGFVQSQLLVNPNNFRSFFPRFWNEMMKPVIVRGPV